MRIKKSKALCKYQTKMKKKYAQGQPTPRGLPHGLLVKALICQRKGSNIKSHGVIPHYVKCKGRDSKFYVDQTKVIGNNKINMYWHEVGQVAEQFPPVLKKLMWYNPVQSRNMVYSNNALYQ